MSYMGGLWVEKIGGTKNYDVSGTIRLNGRIRNFGLSYQNFTTLNIKPASMNTWGQRNRIAATKFF